MALPLPSVVIDFNDAVSRSTYTIKTSWTPPANKAIVIGIVTQNSGGTARTVSSVVGNGITYVKLQEQTYGDGAILSVWRGLSASPTAGTIVASLSSAADGCVALGAAIDDVDTSGSVGSGAIRQSVKGSGSQLNYSFNLGAVGTGTGILAFTGKSTQSAISPGSGYTELDENAQTDDIIIEMQWRDNPQLQVNWSASGLYDWAGVGVEINPNPGTTMLPSPVVLTMTRAAPSFELGNSLTPSPRVITLARVQPALVLGSLVLAPSPVVLSVDLTAADFTFVETPGSRMVPSASARARRPPPNPSARLRTELD